MRGLALSLMVLAGCDAASGIADQVARDAARASVRSVLAQNLPGVPLESATDCVIDNANARELVHLARAGAQIGTGASASPETTRLVVEIATRPDTIRCLATDGLTPFLL